jgi:hypothetical protein
MKTYCFLALAMGVILLAAQEDATAQSWTELSPTGGPPVVRIGHSAVHNPANNRMIVFGGLNGGGFYGVEPKLNDVWILENSDGLGGAPNWIQLSPTGGPPVGRIAHSAIYDPASNRMTIFAGNPNFGYCYGTVNDLWVLENADGLGGTPNWIQLSPTGGPPSKRYIHSAVYDPTNNRMIVLGGHDACGAGNNEVWVLTNANGLGGTPNWTQLSPTGGPSPVAYHIAVYDSGTNRMTVFRGSLYSDVWVLENANGLGGPPNWTQLSPTGGPPTSLHGCGVYDPTTNRMIVYGGYVIGSGGARSNEVWVLDNANGLGGTPNWTQLIPTVPAPERGAHSLILNVGTNRMTMFGGHSEITLIPYNETWVLTLSEPVIEALIDIDPDTLNRKSHGKWITVYITLPDGFDVGEIDTSTIAITSLIGETCDPEYTQGADLGFTPQVGDRDEDGILDLTVKFDRQVLLANLCLDDISITIEGELTAGELFSGSDSIRIIDRGK